MAEYLGGSHGPEVDRFLTATGGAAPETMDQQKHELAKQALEKYKDRIETAKAELIRWIESGEAKVISDPVEQWLLSGGHGNLEDFLAQWEATEARSEKRRVALKLADEQEKAALASMVKSISPNVAIGEARIPGPDEHYARIRMQDDHGNYVDQFGRPY